MIGTQSYRLDDMFARTVQTHGDKVAWVRRHAVDGPRSLTYQDLNACVGFQVGQIRELKLKASPRIGICLPNGPEWVIAAMAIWLSGGVIVPLHTINTPEEMQNHLQAVALDCVFGPADLAAIFPVPALSIDLMDRDDAFVHGAQRQADGADLAALFYTSGSTGKPKVVQLTHRNFVSNVRACQTILPSLNADDCFMALLPYSHAMGLTAQFLLPVYLGARMVAPLKLAGKEIIDCLSQENVSVLVAVPQLFRNMMLTMEKKFAASQLLSVYIKVLRAVPLWLRCVLNRPLLKKFGPIKAWVSGGSRLDPDITRYFHGLGIPLRQGYGLTETSPVACIMDHFDPAHNSVGCPIPGMDVRLEPIPGHTETELWLRGENIMLGYTDPDLTREVMVNGWFRTGDIAEQDDKGRIYITGRHKRVIVTAAGKNVVPEDLEVLLEQEPWVKEACVVEHDQHPVAVIVPDEAVQDEAKFLQVTLQNYNRRVAMHKKIHLAVLCDALPRTPLGKIAFPEVKSYFEWQLAQRDN